MGASSSINNGVYVSCLNKIDKHVIMLRDKIRSLNGFIIDPESEDINCILNCISNVDYVLICLFPDTVRNQNQVIEINYALELQKNVIFICMDCNYTIETYPFLRGLIKDNECLNCCSLEDIDNSLIRIKNLIGLT